MKRFFLMVSMIAAGALMQPAAAQVRIHVNIDLQPSWGPAGYDYAEYYYLPAMDMYYFIPSREYIYLHRGRWVRTTYVPVHYRHVDFYRTYKVVINDRDPFRYHHRHRTQYARYRHHYDQPVWRDVRSRNDRNEWNNNRRNDREWNNRNDRNNNRNNDRNNVRRNDREWDNRNDRNSNRSINREWNNNRHKERGINRAEDRRRNPGNERNNQRGNEQREWKNEKKEKHNNGNRGGGNGNGHRGNGAAQRRTL